MRTETYDIQALVQASGVPRRTIYFYVQQGVLPPPQGAGLGAHYTEEHLLRLRLIPVLRRQGLRLDDIRSHFASVGTEQLRQQLNSGPPPAAGAPAAPQVAEKAAFAMPPRAMPGPGLPLPGAPAAWGQRRVTQYMLPAGITLAAPEDLSPADRQRLQQLLQAAAQIFAGGFVMQEPKAAYTHPDDEDRSRSLKEE